MKKWIFILAAAILLCAASCTRKYEEHHDTLAVSHSLMKVTNDEDMVIQMWVYYSGSWEGHVAEDCDWLRLQNPSGTGTGIVLFDVAARTGTPRNTFVRFTAEGPLCLAFGSCPVHCNTASAAPFITSISLKKRH